MRNSVFASAAVAAVLAAATLFGTGAQAAIGVSSVPGPDGIGQHILFNFDSGTPAGLTGNSQIVIGTSPGAYAAPDGDATHYLAVPKTGTTGSALLDLGAGYDNLSFYWGSIDTYNSVEFFTGAGGSGTSLGVVNGNMIPGATADGTQISTANNRRVFFDFGSDLAQSVRFTSTQIAFELDSIGTDAVPEPAVWGTMLAGFGLVGVTLRRRRQVLSVAA